MRRKNRDSLKSCPYLRAFAYLRDFASDFCNLLLVTFHQAEVIVVKHLVQGRNNQAWVGVEPSTLQTWPS